MPTNRKDAIAKLRAWVEAGQVVSSPTTFCEHVRAEAAERAARDARFDRLEQMFWLLVKSHFKPGGDSPDEWDALFCELETCMSEPLDHRVTSYVVDGKHYSDWDDAIKAAEEFRLRQSSHDALMQQLCEAMKRHQRKFGGT